MANAFDRNQKRTKILFEGKLFPMYLKTMRIHHKTGFTLGAIALGAVVIYWSTSPKHRDRMNSEGH